MDQPVREKSFSCSSDKIGSVGVQGEEGQEGRRGEEKGRGELERKWSRWGNNR